VLKGRGNVTIGEAREETQIGTVIWVVLATWLICPDKRNEAVHFVTRGTEVDICLDFNEIPPAIPNLKEAGKM